MKDPKMLEKKEQLLQLVKGFCEQYLDEDYEQLSCKMVEKLGRKRTVPFMTGKLEVWAAGIIHAIGTVNFLFDKNFEPYVSVHDICGYFGTAQSTTSQKSKSIRDMFKMGYFNDEFATKRSQQNNPFNNLVSINGFIVPADFLKNKE
ncbi:hypothetical protein SAMN04487970_1008107 [Paenibacillus tianmuensis]|uniref:DUF6398 domain-containing protein n=1 Tax=Paenibacillus tianmuensis TaxID=624147 RepID=A0A1G4QRY3_9BACL|nr:DUF6398 domain-containing protein [Paenibacillus tianmuensis]SCW46769.1 hypothetical protein SAMN04487970_1008107 [Paenibacillus tianmuensis]